MPARLEIIVGPMFANKTGELLRRLWRATYSRKRVVAVKPVQDTRTEGAFIATRALVDGKSVVVGTYPATVVSDQRGLGDIFDARPDLLAIDEAHLFGPWLTETIRRGLEFDKTSTMRVVVAGLDLDYRRQPFGCIPSLILEADDILKLKGVCMECGDDSGIFTQRTVKDERQTVIGDYGLYQVRCRACHFIL